MNIEEFSLLLAGIIGLIILYSFIGNLLQHKNWHFIHETGVGILIGFIFGIFVYFVLGQKQLDFNEEVFFYGLLPPMIFAGGYNLKKKDFGKNFIYIMVYAFLGTIVSFVCTFGLTVLINKLGWITTWHPEDQFSSMETSLMIKYSATISASDSVASLTLLKYAEFPKLFSIIFGEGLVNDAVAIILYKVVGGLFDEIHDDMTVTDIIRTVLGSFLGTVFVSVIIGIATALLCSFIFKHCRFLTENQVTQVAFTYIFGILSYVMAQFFNMSGVITVLISGVVLAHYNYYNLTVGGMHASTVTFQSISFIAQAIVFVYLGVSTVYYFLNEVISFSFLGLQLLICIIARCCNIYGLNLIFSKCIKKWNIDMKDLSIVAVGGTIRGSVAFALILTIQSTPQNANQVSVIKSTTLGLVCFTTIILGGMMPKIITWILGENAGKRPPRQSKSLSENEVDIADGEQRLLEVELARPQKKKKKAGFFKYSDQNYWRPYFIYKYEERKDIFKLYKKIMKYNSRADYQGGAFYLLNLVEVDQATLHDYVLKIEAEEKRQIVKQYEENSESKPESSSANDGQKSNGMVNDSRA